MVASSVLAAAVIGIVMPLIAAGQQSDTMAQQTMGLALARELLEEIAAQPFDSPAGVTVSGPSTGMTRRGQYTSIGNYNGYSDSTSALKSIDGTSITYSLGGQVYSRSVKVQFQTSWNGTAATTGNYALVTVTVTPPTAPAVTLARLMTNITQQW